MAERAGEIAGRKGSGAEGATAPETLRQTEPRGSNEHSGKRRGASRGHRRGKLSGIPTEGAGGKDARRPRVFPRLSDLIA